MGRSNFGNELRAARERQGISIDMAASRLRIRPDILHSIEEGDFSRMPQRGYARNMINAYARYLGLNASHVTTMYLDELHAYQASVQGISFDRVTNAPQAGRGDSSRRSRNGGDAGPVRQRRNPPYSESTGRPVYSDRTDRNPIYDQDDYGRRERNAMRENARRSHSSGRLGGTAAPASVVGRNRTYDNLFSGNKGPGIASKLPVIIGAVVVIALLIFIITSVASCASNKPSSNTANIPISGVSDTTANANTNENTEATQQVKVPPSQATFQYNVPEGKSAYIEIYEDGSSTPVVADDINGPSTGTYQVTTTLKFVTTVPENVTLSVDGSPVSPSDKNDGIYTYTVDFPAILQAWNQANGVRTATVGTTTGTAASAGTTTGTTTGASGTTTGTTSSSQSTGTTTNTSRN